MALIAFNEWLNKQQPLVPAADSVVPIIWAAGPAGITRSDLGNRVRLDRTTLDDLLQSLLNMGQINAARENGKLVFRAGR